MPVTFSLASPEAHAVVRAMMAEHHPMLRDAGVTVGVLFASSDKEDVPALKHKGAAVAATMQVVGLKDRVLKKVDAQMVINLEAWDKMSDAGKDALCDHELCHLALKDGAYWKVLGPDGKPVRGPAGEFTGEEELRFERDDLGRPKLRLVHGDVEGGDGFHVIIARHGFDALEYANLTQVGRWAEKALDDYLGRRRPTFGAGERPVDVTATWTDADGEVVTVGAWADDEESGEQEGVA